MRKRLSNEALFVYHFWEVLMTNPFTRIFRARDKPRNAVSAAPAFYFGYSVSGKTVTARSAIQLSTVYACVRVIAETVASLPLNVFESTGKGGRQGAGSSAAKAVARRTQPGDDLVRLA